METRKPDVMNSLALAPGLEYFCRTLFDECNMDEDPDEYGRLRRREKIALAARGRGQNETIGPSGSFWSVEDRKLVFHDAFQRARYMKELFNRWVQATFWRRRLATTARVKVERLVELEVTVSGTKLPTCGARGRLIREELENSTPLRRTVVVFRQAVLFLVVTCITGTLMRTPARETQENEISLSRS